MYNNPERAEEVHSNRAENMNSSCQDLETPSSLAYHNLPETKHQPNEIFRAIETV